jgi:glycosyltransferase involved in cell wall biosynthesis
LAEVNPSNGQPTVFSFSYTALQLFREAKRHGAMCVLGQIDPGPEEICWVQERCGGQSALDSPPSAYWDSWREEIELSDVVIANSEWSRKLLIQGGVPKNKIQVVPLAYERPELQKNFVPRRYPSAFSKSRKLKVLFLGQVIPRKGAQEWFEALPLLGEAPIEFHIAGPIGMAIPNEVKNNANVHFYGPVAQDQARRLYRESDVFLLPTHSDGFAITQLEAAAHGLPIIASRFCASDVEHEKNGLLLDEVTPSGIAQAIRACVENPASLCRWAAHELDWTNYSIETLGARLAEL